MQRVAQEVYVRVANFLECIVSLFQTQSIAVTTQQQTKHLCVHLSLYNSIEGAD